MGYEKPARQPRYRMIAMTLQQEIRRGVHPVGSLLPTETDLTQTFSTGRQTIREALRIITEQGLIVRRAGHGSVVISSEPPVHFTHRVGSIQEWMRYTTETYREVVRSGEIIADRKLAAFLKCETGKRWFRIESLRRSDAHAAPLGFVEIYVLRKYADVIKRRDHGRTPVHAQIAKMFGETVERAQLEILTRRVPSALVGPLAVAPGSPTLTVIRRYFNARDELFEITVTTHPEGRYTYTMEMQRELRPSP
jgi:DNA-binding GntR family transcriptional regulator